MKLNKIQFDFKDNGKLFLSYFKTARFELQKLLNALSCAFPSSSLTHVQYSSTET